MDNKKSGNFNKIALKSGSVYMLSNILISSSAIITAPIFTRILSTSDYGIASNFAAWVTIGLVIIGLGLPYSIGNARIDFPEDLNKFLASIQTLGSLMAVIVLVIAIFFREELGVLMEMDQYLVVSIFVYLLVFPSVTYAQERYRYLLKYKQNIYISLIGTLGAILFSFIFILLVFNDNRYYGRIFGLIFTMFLMGIFFYIKIIKDGWDPDIKRYWKYALKIGAPMIPHSIAMVVFTQIDRIMIIKFCGNSDAGLYSFGFAYAILLNLFSNAVLQAYQPWLYVSYKNDDLLSIKSSSNLIALCMCILTLFVIGIAPEALQILGGPDFWEAKWVVMPIAVGALFQYLYNTYTGLELYHKKTIIIMAGTFIAAIINYVLNMLFLPMFGYVAAAYATLASYFVLAFYHLFAYKKITGKSVYNDKFIWTICLGTAFLSFLILQTYEFIIIRYLILAVLFLLAIGIGLRKKKEIMTIFAA